MWFSSISTLIDTILKKFIRTPEQTKQALDNKERKRQLNAKKKAKKYFRKRLKRS